MITNEKKIKNLETWCWLKAGGPCGYYYSEGCEYQRATSKACLPMGKQSGVIRGKKQLTGAFPRQELQLPTRPSCILCLLTLQPLARSETHNTPAKGLQRTLSKSPIPDLRSSPI